MQTHSSRCLNHFRRVLGHIILYLHGKLQQLSGSKAPEWFRLRLREHEAPEIPKRL